MATRAGAIGNLPWVRGTSQPGVRMAPRGAQHKEAINAELAAEGVKIGGKQFIQKYGLATWAAINSIDTQNQEFEKNIKDIDEGKDKEEEVSTEVKEELPKLPEEEPEGPDIGTQLATESAIQSKKLLEDKELDVSQQTKNLTSKIKNKIKTWEYLADTKEEFKKLAEENKISFEELEKGALQSQVKFRKEGPDFGVYFDNKKVAELINITRDLKEEGQARGNTNTYNLVLITSDGYFMDLVETLDGIKGAKYDAKQIIAGQLITEGEKGYSTIRKIFQEMEYNKKGLPAEAEKQMEKIKKELK